MSWFGHIIILICGSINKLAFVVQSIVAENDKGLQNLIVDNDCFEDTQAALANDIVTKLGHVWKIKFSEFYFTIS